MRVVIDRLEGDIAVVELENGKVIDAPKVLFSDAKEGDIVYIEINRDETESKKDEIQSRFDNLIGKD